MTTERDPASLAPVDTPDESYERLVQRLGELVQRLESGGLSLEESIQAFEQGTRLAHAGLARLAAAERRVEQLLEDGRLAPLEQSRRGGERA